MDYLESFVKQINENAIPAEPINLDDTERARAVIKTATTVDELKEMFESFIVALGKDRAEQHKISQRLERVAIATLIANWGAVALALVLFFIQRYG